MATQGGTFGKKIALGFGLSVVMLLVVGTVAYRSTDALVENNHRVTHTHEVLEGVARVVSVMKDAMEMLGMPAGPVRPPLMNVLEPVSYSQNTDYTVLIVFPMNTIPSIQVRKCTICQMTKLMK